MAVFRKDGVDSDCFVYPLGDFLQEKLERIAVHSLNDRLDYCFV